MARYTSGAEAAEFIYTNVIPKVRACAKGLNATASPKDRLAAQIDCVLREFGKKAA